MPGLSHERLFSFTESQEALSWLKFSFLDFEGAINSSNSWALEEPYSKSPYILGSIAACHAGRYEKAIEIGLRGLRSNPKDETLLNNLAFSYLRNGQTEKARYHFEPIKHLVKNESEIAPAATYGLLLMAEGDQDAGCEFYVTAIERAWKAGQKRTALRASLNFLISTIDTANCADPALVGAITQAMPYYHDPGCYGAAFTALKRMRETGIALTPALGPSYRELDQVTKRESSHYLGLTQGRFMDVVGTVSGDQILSISAKTDNDEVAEPNSMLLSSIRNFFRLT
jgi:tetratricopeptide (TPR) repeat protein